MVYKCAKSNKKVGFRPLVCVDSQVIVYHGREKAKRGVELTAVFFQEGEATVHVNGVIWNSIVFVRMPTNTARVGKPIARYNWATVMKPPSSQYACVPLSR